MLSNVFLIEFFGGYGAYERFCKTTKQQIGEEPRKTDILYTPKSYVDAGRILMQRQSYFTNIKNPL